MTDPSERRAPRRLPLAFTGSAAELRQHSRRDLLVNIVLGGLYTSIARRHTADYLASRTTLDGTPLAHVPQRKSRLPAIVLVLAFLALRLANEFDAGPPLPVVIACGVLLLPYLWGTVAARTIGAVRWRDLSLHLAAGWTGIYRASWPLFVLGGAWALAEPAVAAVAEQPRVDLHFVAGAALAALLAFPLVAAQAYQWRRLRFTRTRVGDDAVTWQARFPAYLRVWVASAAAILVTAVLPLLVLRLALFGSATLQGLSEEAAAAAYVASLLLVLLLSTPARAWHEARIFVLTWDGVRVGERVRVTCTLDPRAFARLRTRDTWRTWCTLGRHRAQALVNAHTAKLAALQVEAC